MSYGNVLAETQWEKMRLGKITASEIGVLFSANERKRTDGKIDGKFSDGAKTYLRKKVSEHLTGYIRQLSVFATQWGEQYEPEAIELLKKEFPEIIHFGGNEKTFFQYGEFFAGGSPDAEFKNISFEIKCPENFENHIEYSMMKNAIELHKDYYYQTQFNMLILSKKLGIPFEDMKGFFVSYCPLILREEKRLFKMEIAPDMNFYNQVSEKLLKAQDYMIEILESFSK